MEKEPNTENVAYIDEYPELAEKLRLQRLAQPALKHTFQTPKVVELPRHHPDHPDGAA